LRIVVAGNKERGAACLRALLAAAEPWEVAGALAHPAGKGPEPPGSFAETVFRLGLPLLRPADVNDPAALAWVRGLRPDLVVLAGYGQIVRRPFLELASRGCINLHGGRLPQYRGSSPMNWALIRGEKEFTVSVLQVDEGVDTGDVLAERTFPIGPDDTIADLQTTANRAFPGMLVEVVGQVAAGTLRPRRQDEAEAAYFPLRFPDDGLILWDLHTAEQIHNRIRALTDPYPGAFTSWNGRRIKLLRSKLAGGIYHGEPGRVYRKGPQGLLVCAADRCLWVSRAVVTDGGADAVAAVARYDKLATVRDLAMAGLAALSERQACA